MAYYDALIAAWNSATQPPTGVTGTALTGLTTANKLIAVNAWTMIGPSSKANLRPSDIINACVAADLIALSASNVALLQLLLSGQIVDASIGTTVRSVFQTLFAGKTTTLSRLSALVAPFDSPVISWCKGNGYPEAQNGGGGLTEVDLASAGGLV